MRRDITNEANSQKVFKEMKEKIIGPFNVLLKSVYKFEDGYSVYFMLFNGYVDGNILSTTIYIVYIPEIDKWFVYVDNNYRNIKRVMNHDIISVTYDIISVTYDSLYMLRSDGYTSWLASQVLGKC